MGLKRIINLSVLLSGITAMTSQIIFMRELLVVFSGSEISFGFILASWLLWGGAGSFVLGRFTSRITSPVKIFSLCQLALAFILPLTFFAIRDCKNFMHLSTGEVPGYFYMAWSSLAVLSAVCVLMGFMFVLACRIYGKAANSPAEGVSWVYVIEAAGALAGGAVTSYFLIRFLDPFTIIFILAFLNIALSVLVMQRSEGTKNKKSLSYAICLILVLCLAVFFGGAGKWVIKRSVGVLWKGYNVIDSLDSVYGNITLTKKGGETSFYDNGLHLYTVPDVLSAEKAVHPALLEHAKPESVLLLGGGVGGLVDEILKYKVKHVDYVELDPAIIKEAEKNLGQKEISFLKRKEVRVINQDGRFYVKRTGKKYDCVIISLGDPHTAQINRFYTVEFFREVKNILNPGGIVSFGLTSSENYIGEDLKEYLGSIYSGVKKVFGDCLVIPGDTACFIASNGKGILTGDPAVLARRLEERGIATSYIKGYYLPSEFSPDRLGAMARDLDSVRNVRLNTDFHPITYFYALAFWLAQFDMPVFKTFSRYVTPLTVWGVVIVLCASAVTVFFIKKRRGKREAALFCLFTTGFSGIIFQIILLLAFQVIYGFIFYRIGVIMTAYMAGLALGGRSASRHIGEGKDVLKGFTAAQLGLVLFPVLLPAVFMILSNAKPVFCTWLGSNAVFPALSVLAGFLGGYEFPLASKLYMDERSGGAGEAAGASYGWDLFGAALGALMASTFLIPITGIFSSCFILALVGMTGLIALLKRT